MFTGGSSDVLAWNIEPESAHYVCILHAGIDVFVVCLWRSRMVLPILTGVPFLTERRNQHHGPLPSIPNLQLQMLHLKKLRTKTSVLS